jgi:ppGpp synthetase/RelA/SpoT-type nucleotidyltranferase
MSDDSVKPDQIEELVSSYWSARPTYEAFVDNVGTLLVSLLRTEGVDHLPIEKRTKTIESFRAKLIRPEKEEKYRTLTDMTDLAGIRIVVYYEKDVERICNTIRMNFLVDEANSTDKTGIIDPDRFGYLSKHFVVSHGKRRRDLPENTQFADLKAEIQIRTVVQHAWAAIDRRLRYNNEADIPRELRRKLFRISALLELADKEFSEVDTAINTLRAQYEKGVRAGDLQIEINRDSVEVFLTDSKTVAHIR